jgi:hypothetical protein
MATVGFSSYTRGDTQPRRIAVASTPRVVDLAP